MARETTVALFVASFMIGSTYSAPSQAYTWNNVVTGGKYPPGHPEVSQITDNMCCILLQEEEVSSLELYSTHPLKASPIFALILVAPTVSVQTTHGRLS
jgi:hypothetical protein